MKKDHVDLIVGEMAREGVVRLSRGERIRGTSLAEAVKRLGSLNIRGATVNGVVDLSGLAISDLIFSDMFFHDGVSFDRVSINRCSIYKCRINGGLSVNYSTIAQDFVVEDSKIRGQISMVGSSASTINCMGSMIDFVSLNKSTLRRNAVFIGAHILETLNVENSSINGDLDLGGALLSGRPGLAGDKAIVGGNLFLDRRFSSMGGVVLPLVAGQIVSDERDDEGLDLLRLEAAVPKQGAAPIGVEMSEGKFILSPGGGTERAEAPGVAAMHAELTIAARGACDKIGGNHPDIAETLRRYVGALGNSIDAVNPASLGAIGICLQGYLEAYFEDGKDMLAAEQRGAAGALLALHNLFIRMLPEWRSVIDDAWIRWDEPALAAVKNGALELAEATDIHSDIFDPEIARTFRFFANAMKIQSRAKEIGVGILRSIENVVAEACRMAARYIRGAFDAAVTECVKKIGQTTGVAIVGFLTFYVAKMTEILVQFPERFVWATYVVDALKRATF